MIHHGDCLDVMATFEPESIDAIVTDPPYGLSFMGKEWDRLGDIGKTSHAGIPERDASNPYGRTRVAYGGSSNVKCRKCGKWQWDHIGRKCECERPDFPSVSRHQGVLMGQWHEAWAREALRVAKPGAYLLAFGGTRTVHRLACAIEDAGWIIRDTLVWAYASGFPKSKASLKPAWEPIVMARKPGPLRMLNIDECRISMAEGDGWDVPQADLSVVNPARSGAANGTPTNVRHPTARSTPAPLGRWPANLILTDPIFDGDTPGVVGGGEQSGGGNPRWASPEASAGQYGGYAGGETGKVPVDTSGTYSRFFLIPKADRSDREPVLAAAMDGTGRSRYPTRSNHHPTVKPTELMRHIVRLVTPQGGTVLDPFLGSGTTALAAEMEGFAWVGIEKEAEYVAIAEARLNGTQRGMAL